MAKRHINIQIGDYKVVVRDYQYKGRPPVGVRVSGTRLGESVNPFGEPCYFYKSEDAMSLFQGLAIAKAIIAAQEKKEGLQ